MNDRWNDSSPHLSPFPLSNRVVQITGRLLAKNVQINGTPYDIKQSLNALAAPLQHRWVTGCTRQLRIVSVACAFIIQNTQDTQSNTYRTPAMWCSPLATIIIKELEAAKAYFPEGVFKRTQAAIREITPDGAISYHIDGPVEPVSHKSQSSFRCHGHISSRLTDK